MANREGNRRAKIKYDKSLRVKANRTEKGRPEPKKLVKLDNGVTLEE